MQYLGAAFFLWHLWRKGRSPGGVRLRWVVSVEGCLSCCCSLLLLSSPLNPPVLLPLLPALLALIAACCLMYFNTPT
jgi:hypothetical protein